MSEVLGLPLPGATLSHDLPLCFPTATAVVEAVTVWKLASEDPCHSCDVDTGHGVAFWPLDAAVSTR